MHVPEQLDERQLETLKRLVCIPSPSGGEQPILEFIETRCQQFEGCRLVRQGQDRQNLIVRKGTGSEFGLLLYVHVDTVPRKEGWENNYNLQRDIGADRLRGVGVYDMKSQVMIALDILERATIPDGVTLTVVFSSAEESNSAGVQALVDGEGERLKNGCHLILSSDITTYRGYECDAPKSVVIARRGNLKTAVTVSVPEGHGYNDEAPNAPDAAREMQNHFFEQFARAERTDKHCGSECLRTTRLHAEDSDYASLTAEASWGFRQWLVPESTVEEAFRWQQDCAARLAETKNWARLGIQYTLVQRSGSMRSYNPFRTSPQDPLLQRIVLPSVDRVYGSHQLAGGLSTADTNVLADLGIPIAEVAPIGGDAHRGTEWVSERSVARLIAFQHDLITHQIPFYLRERK
ncbi:MAG: M20/M25/M40 family metallo-hydrolase [Candidatus Peribacteraceae bacterium]|nr:M20/M25/M40 family metallo-hydrolase [Candidatus Peribacteraceae bacterium]